MRKEYLKPAMKVRKIALKADYAQFYSYHEGCATPQDKGKPCVEEKEWGNLW